MENEEWQIFWNRYVASNSQQNSTDRQGKSTNGEHRIQSSQYRLQACAAEKLMNAMRIIGLFLYEMARETANLG